MKRFKCYRLTTSTSIRRTVVCMIQRLVGLYYTMFVIIQRLTIVTHVITSQCIHSSSFSFVQQGNRSFVTFDKNLRFPTPSVLYTLVIYGVSLILEKWTK